MLDSNRDGCGFDSHSKQMQRFRFHALVTNKARRYVSYTPCCRNWKRSVGNGVSYHFVLFAYPAICGIQLVIKV